MTLEAPADELYPGGELWRTVINFIGDEPITPALYLPLLDHIAPGGDRWSYFVGRMADMLREDRHDIEEQVARADLGYRIWTERRQALARWARVGPVDLEDWWLHGEPTVEDHERQRQFIKMIGLTAADLALIEEDLGRGWERIGYHGQVDGGARHKYMVGNRLHLVGEYDPTVDIFGPSAGVVWADVPIPHCQQYVARRMDEERQRRRRDARRDIYAQHLQG